MWSEHGRKERSGPQNCGLVLPTSLGQGLLQLPALIPTPSTRWAPSSEPWGFCSLSLSLLNRNKLITLKMAAIPSWLYLRFTWWFFLASVPQTPLSLRLPGTQPWPQRALDTPAPVKCSSCLISSSTSSEEAPHDSSLSPTGSYRTPGSSWCDTPPKHSSFLLLWNFLHRRAHTPLHLRCHYSPYDFYK